MKKFEKILLFILILVVILGISVGGTYLVFDNNVKVEVKELSILQEKYFIEANYENVSDSPEKQEDSKDDNSKNEKDKEGSSKSNKNGKNSKSSSSGYGASNGGGGYTGSVTVENATYTPRIRIPRTGINCVIYPEMSVSNMERGVVILNSQNGLNEPGNTVISGHNLGNRKFFSRNDRIQIGDLIYVTDPSGRVITYTVYETYVTGPNDAEYIDRDTNGDTEISLTTCTLDSTQRIIVLAIEI